MSESRWKGWGKGVEQNYDGSTIEFRRCFRITDRSEEVKAGTDGEADRDDRKVTSNGSPLKVMFTSNNVAH
jgi:hypothetical protein